MTAAAKKWLSEYKRLFNEVSAYNKGQSEGAKKIEKLGRLVESAECRVQNAELDDGSRAAASQAIITSQASSKSLKECPHRNTERISATKTPKKTSAPVNLRTRANLFAPSRNVFP